MHIKHTEKMLTRCRGPSGVAIVTVSVTRPSPGETIKPSPAGMLPLRIPEKPQEECGEKNGRKAHTQLPVVHATNMPPQQANLNRICNRHEPWSLTIIRLISLDYESAGKGDKITAGNGTRRLGNQSPAILRNPKDLRHNRGSAVFDRVDQVLGMEFQLLQPYLFELFILGEIRLLNQLFQPLSVATVFCVQATNFFTQRGILYFIHQAPPGFKGTFTYSSLPRRKGKRESTTK